MEIEVISSWDFVRDKKTWLAFAVDRKNFIRRKIAYGNTEEEARRMAEMKL